MTDHFADYAGVTPVQCVALLNEIHAADPTVLPALINHRVPCNEALAEHPTVQVGGAIGDAEVGLLGILNGIFGIVPGKTSGYIAAYYDDDRNLTHFVNLGEPTDSQAEAHRYTVDAYIVGAEPYPCTTCGQPREAHSDREAGE